MEDGEGERDADAARVGRRPDIIGDAGDCIIGWA